jgi:hypothetical protein
VLIQMQLVEVAEVQPLVAALAVLLVYQLYHSVVRLLI